MQKSLWGIALCLFFISQVSTAQNPTVSHLKGSHWLSIYTVVNPPATLELVFDTKDTMTITNAVGQTVPIAIYQESNDTVMINDINPGATGCATTGTYTFQIQSDSLTLTEVLDLCLARVNFMTTNDWFRKGIGMSEETMDVMVSVYPNPAGNKMQVRCFKELNTEYHIFSIAGQKIQSGTLSSTNNTLDISNLTPGVYMLNIPELGSSLRFKKI